MNALEIRNLEKYYGRKKIIKNVDLDVPQGVLFALLGPNGAGKTTLIKSVLNFTSIKSGSIKIGGMDRKNFRGHEKVAYFPEKFFFFPYYTVEGVLRFYGSMYGIKGGLMKSRIDEIAKYAGIHDILDMKLNKISKGQMQRVGIGSVLMSEADLYIFDEPFSGLDPIGIKNIKDIFQSLKKKGKTVFINSHILAEIEKIVDYVAIINKGNILYSGELDDFVSGRSLEDAFYNLIEGGE